MTRGRRRSAGRARRALRAGLAAAAFGALAGAAAAEAPAPVVRGRLTVSFAEYFPCANEDAFVRGESVLLTGGGFLPDEAVAVTLEQDGAEVAVASVRATARGGLSAIVAIPAAASAESEARLFARAERGEGGGGVSLRSPPLRIFADARDADGDGVQDRCDTCPALPGADLTDSDADGLGDACDVCPNDAANDSDADGLCADVDPNPYAPEPGAPPAGARGNG